MNKIPSSLDGGGCVCFVCHSNSVVFSPSIEDTFFLFNKMFEVPAEHFVKLFSQQPSAAVQQLQFCCSCKVDIESAKDIYQQLVVAVGQFRNIQRKLADAVKVERNGKAEPQNVAAADHCWSLLHTAVSSNKARIFGSDNFEENTAFLVEDLNLKLGRVTGTSQISHSGVIEEEQNGEAVLVSNVGENTVASDESSRMETDDDGEYSDNEDFEPDEILKPSDTEQQDEPKSSIVNSPVSIKEESFSEEESMYTDDEGTMGIIDERNSSPQQIVKTEPLSENEEPTHSNSEPPRFQCSKCDTIFSTKTGLNIHMSKMHSKKSGNKKRNENPDCKGKFKCPEKNCGKSFRRPFLLKEHHAAVHSKQPIYKCELCDDVFYRKSSLGNHERTNHSHKESRVAGAFTDNEIQMNSTSDCDSSGPVTEKRDGQARFQCSICRMDCSTNRGLRIHMSRKHKIYGPRKSSTRTKTSFKFHSTKEGKYSCSECEKSFSRPHLLQIHISRHNKQPMFQCQSCQKMFYTRTEQTRHERQVHPELVTPEPEHITAAANFRAKLLESYKCNQCCKEFKKNSALTIHKRIVHGIVEPRKERVCPEGCGRVFKTKHSLEKLREHLSRCHGWEPTYKCSKCDKVFNTWKQKWRHEDKAHADPDTTRSFICDLCGKQFTCHEYLSTHRSTIHRKKKSTASANDDTSHVPQRYSCNLCGGSYCSPSSLQTHKILKHTNMEPVVCEICGKIYKSPGPLKLHKLLAHEKDKLKAACQLCDKRFLGGRQLAKHMYRQHQVGELKEEPPKGQMFQCKIVGCKLKFYKDKSKLDNHMKEVHGEDGKKPGAFKCRYCGQGFFLGWKVRHHEMIHENKDTRPYICDICEKGFPTPYYLKFHKTHTHKLVGVKVEHGSRREEVSKE